MTKINCEVFFILGKILIVCLDWLILQHLIVEEEIVWRKATKKFRSHQICKKTHCASTPGCVAPKLPARGSPRMCQCQNPTLYTRCKFPPVCNCGRGISFSLDNKAKWTADEFSHYKSHFNSLFIALLLARARLNFLLGCVSCRFHTLIFPCYEHIERLSVSATLTLFLPQALSTKRAPNFLPKNKALSSVICWAEKVKWSHKTHLAASRLSLCVSECSPRQSGLKKWHNYSERAVR